jgi:hypothetical protein
MIRLDSTTISLSNSDRHRPFTAFSWTVNVPKSTLSSSTALTRLLNPQKIRNYTFLYRRRSGYFSALSLSAGHLITEIIQTSTREKIPPETPQLVLLQSITISLFISSSSPTVYTIFIHSDSNSPKATFNASITLTSLATSFTKRMSSFRNSSCFSFQLELSDFEPN